MIEQTAFAGPEVYKAGNYVGLRHLRIDDLLLCLEVCKGLTTFGVEFETFFGTKGPELYGACAYFEDDMALADEIFTTLDRALAPLRERFREEMGVLEEG